MILFKEHLGWTYSIEWWEGTKYIVVVFNKNDDKPRTSCKYESQYEAEVLVLQTVIDLSQWYQQ